MEEPLLEEESTNDISKSREASFTKHYAALMKKTFITKKRTRCASCCELCSPIVFVAMFCLIYLASKDVLHLDQYAMINYPVMPNRGPFGKNPPMPQPEISIKALDNHGWKIALYPKGDPVMTKFADWADEYMPGFNSTQVVGEELEKLDVPKFTDVVKWFDSEEDLDDYIRDADYNNNPLIATALTIKMDEESKWTVTVRANGTTVPTTYLDVMVTTRAYPTQRTTNYVEMYSTLQPTQLVQTFKDGCKMQDLNQWTCSSIFLKHTHHGDPNHWINNYWLPSFVTVQAWADKYIMYAEGVEPDFSKVCPDFQGSTRFTDCLFDAQFGVYTYYPRLYNRNDVLRGNISKLSFEYFAKQKKKMLANVDNVTLLEEHSKQFLKSRAMFPHELRTSTFPSPKYEQNDFYNDAVLNSLSFFFVLSFSYSIFQLIKSIVWEKESKIKEGMKMMGLVESAILWSWITTYVVIFFFVSIGVTIICKTTVFGASDTSILFVFFFSFSMSSVCYAYLITVFFDKATSAAVMGALIFVGGYFPIYAVNDDTSTRNSKVMCSLLSPVAMGLGMNTIGFFESARIGVTWINWNEVDQNMCLRDMVLMMWIDCVVYLVLGWYLERVLPSEYGVSRPFYFPLRPSFWFGNSLSTTTTTSSSNTTILTTNKENEGLLVDLDNGQDIFVPMTSNDVSKLSSGGIVHKTSHGVSFKATLTADEKKWFDAEATMLNLDDTSSSSAIFSASRLDRFDYLAGSDGSDKFESLSNEEKRMLVENKCVHIRNLRKVFHTADGTERVAVNDLRCTMFQNQIFVLLGHNGAGKSTTLSQLSGLIAPTSGDATVFGRNIVGELSQVQQMIGVCPQQNILYEHLTVMEHLRLYAALKNVPKCKVEEQATSLLQDIALTTKRHALIPTLSGGQKRKVCLAISLVGDSKVLFLDEPTSGMDVFAQRSTWNLLKMKRKGRVIVLTTHSMEEADILADRIGIMASGRMICCGSPMFLKSRFGVGYNLVCTRPSSLLDSKKEEKEEIPTPGADILPLIENRLGSSHEVEVVSDIGKEVSFRLPLDSADRFPDLFEEFDRLISSKKNLESYNVSVTTIEEVFIKSAEAANRKQAARRRSSTLRMLAKQSDDFDEEKEEEQENKRDSYVESEGDRIRRLYSQSRCFTHFGALLRKRFQNAKRDVKALLFQNIIPIVALLGGLLIIKYVVHYDYPSVTPSVEILNTHTKMPLKDTTPMVWQPNNAVFGLKNEMAKSEPSTRPYFVDNHENLLKKWPGNVSKICLNKGDAELFATGFSEAFDYYIQAAELFENPHASSISESETNREKMLCAINQELLSYVEPNATFDASTYFAMFTNDGTNTSDSNPVSYTAIANMSALHTTPLLISAIDSAYLRNKTGNEDASIKIVNHPLVMTQHQRAMLGALSSSGVVFFIGLAIAFIPAAVCEYLVYETYHEVKHQQLVSGVSLAAYWTSSFVWDWIQYLVTATVCVLLIVGFDISQYTDNDESQFKCVILLFVLYGPAAIGLAYNQAYLFKKPYFAVNCLLVFNLVCLIASLAVTILAFFDSTCETSIWLRHIFMIIPNYAFIDGFYRLSLLSGLPFAASICDSSVDVTTKWDALEIRAVGLNLIYMAASIVVYPLLAVAIDTIYSYPSMQQYVCGGLEPEVQDDGTFEDDQDVKRVANETKALVRDGSDDDNKMVQIRGLRKVYRTKDKSGNTVLKAAVKDTWLTVDRGECFGLLGTNGAGKSTTFKMLSGDVLPSKGTALLGHRDVLTDQIAVRALIGYCPQFNALLPRLTCREHLELFARIKGISEANLECVVKEKIQELDLVEFENKRAGSLSGGNKRKLCVAIALIGNPPIIFLDEPSAGMDPVAKRFMWEVISRVSTLNKSSTIILTTHSMEECSALCSRMCIMVDGRLRCVGSEQHIKDRFGNGYQLKLRFEEPDDGDMIPVLRKIKDTLENNEQDEEEEKVDEEEEVGLLQKTSSTTTRMFTNLIFSSGSSTEIPKDGVRKDQIRSVCRNLGDVSRSKKFESPTSSAWLLQDSLEKDGFIPIERFAAWWVMENCVDDAVRWCKKTFGEDAYLFEQHGGVNITIALPKFKNMRLSQIFRILTESKSKLKVVEYSLGQTTLEQIFLKFAQLQDGEGDHVRGIASQE